MAQPQLIQGSWEEISARAVEFKDRNDLLLIIPGEVDQKHGISKQDMTLAEALKGRTGLVSFEPTDLSENTGQKFTDLLVEQYQREAE